MKKIVGYILLTAVFLSGCTRACVIPKDITEEEIIAEEVPAIPEDTAEEIIAEEVPAAPEDTADEANAAEEIAKEPEVPEPEEVTVPEFNEEPASDINALPNDNNGWGFVKKKDSFPEFTKGQKDMMAKYNCIYEGNPAEKVLYLTFDEGYENGYTGAILDTLKEKGVPAAFFITGPYLEKNSDLIGRMVAEGHIVGNHTVNHPNMPSKGTKEAMQEEILNLDRRFFELYGRHMSYFRPPEGAYSERSLAATKEIGYTTVLWSFAYKDWETDNQMGADYAFESVTPYLHNGCVILLHAVSKDNTEALGRIIDDARAKGYTFKSLDEFLY